MKILGHLAMIKCAAPIEKKWFALGREFMEGDKSRWGWSVDGLVREFMERFKNWKAWYDMAWTGMLWHGMA